MLRLLRLVAIPFIAWATIALTTTCVWAWTQQAVSPNGNYNFNYGPLDDKSKSGDSTNKTSRGCIEGVKSGARVFQSPDRSIAVYPAAP
jgi:hypothetical protein